MSDAEQPTKAHRAEGSSTAAAADPQQQPQHQRTVVLRHLVKTPPLVSEAELRARAAADFGAVEGVTVLTHGGLVGTAFVDFADPSAAAKCVRQLSDSAAPEAASWKHFAADPTAAAITAELKAPRASNNKKNAEEGGAGAAAASSSDVTAPDGQQLNRKQRRALARKHLGEEHRSTATSSQQQQEPSEGAAATPVAASSSSTAASSTLFVRGKYVAAIFDVFAFFKQHGIEGKLRNCVFVTTSRKPYFLVDCTGNKDFYTAALAASGSAYKGEAVSVSPSAQTCDDYLLKKPDAVCSKKIEHNGSGFDKSGTAAASGSGGGRKQREGAGDGGEHGHHAGALPEAATNAPDMAPEQTAEAAAASLAFKPRMLRKR
jgi:hypothetical protein